MTHIVKSGSLAALAFALVAGLMPGAAWAQIAADAVSDGQPVFQTVAQQRDGRRGGSDDQGWRGANRRGGETRGARAGGVGVTGTPTRSGRQRSERTVPTAPQVRQRGGAAPSLGRDSGTFGLSNVRRSGDRRTADPRADGGRDYTDRRADRADRNDRRNRTYRSGYANGAAADARDDRRDRRQAYTQGYRNGVRSDDYYGRARQRYVTPGYGTRYAAGARGNVRAWDNRGWRNDRRYDWAGYRARNRTIYSPGRYFAPFSNYRYNRVGIGFQLGAVFFSSRYLINDPYTYRLPPAYGPYRWVRYYDDVLLVNTYTGDVVDVIYDFFY